ncbi:MAG TPA: M15 family metallopeptidase [Acidimicrobiia bacterium]|nr:M15 family metallopeptidase [Acidimicrobiia bacterium]
MRWVWKTLVGTALLAVSVPLPASIVGEQFPIYTGEEFKALYDYAVAVALPNLDPPGERLQVTGDAELDDRIWEIAVERGYILRPLAGEALGNADGVIMQPQAAAAWSELKSAARAAGLGFIVSSAYRSPESQRDQFLSKLRGTSDEAIDAALTWYSIPGTSKHHSGYALDFRYRDGTFGAFRDTPDYAWLAADNFHNAKRFGFIPSYPDDVAEQGPNPEPWEFVWVGVDLIECGIPLEVDPDRFGAHESLVRSIALCPGTASPPGLGQALPHWLLRVPAAGVSV